MNNSTLISYAITIAFLVVMIGVYYHSRTYFFNPYGEKTKAIRSANELVNRYKGTSVSNTNVFQELSSEIKKNEVVGPMWSDYEKTLISIESDYGVSFYSTENATYFFNAEDAVSDLDVNYWKNFAGVFTGLGILGTFVGLTYGLMGIDSTSTAMLQEGIVGLLGGMTAAFATSIFGILGAMFYGYHFSGTVSDLNAEIHKFSDTIDSFFPRKRSEQILADSLKEIRDQTSEIKMMGTDLAEQFSRSIDEAPVFNKLENAIGKMSDSLNNLNSSIDKLNTSGVNEIAGSLDKNIGRQLKDFADTLTSLQNEMKKTFDRSTDASQKGADSLKGVIQELLLVNKEINKSMRDQLQAVNDAIASMIKQVSSAHANAEDTSRKITQTAENAANGMAHQMAQRNEQQMKALTDTINKLMDKVSALNTQAAETSRQASADTMNTVKDVVADLIRETNVQVKAMRDSIDQMKAEVIALNKDSADISKKANTETIASVQAVIQDMLYQSEEQSKAMRESLDTMKSEVLSLNKASAANSKQVSDETMGAVKEVIDELIKQTNTQIQVINTSTEEMKKLVAAMNQSVTDSANTMIGTIHEQTHEDINTINNTMGDMKSTLDEIMNKINSQMDIHEKSIETVMKELKDSAETNQMILDEAGHTADQFKNAAMPMQKVAEQMDDNLSNMMDANENFMNDMNQNLIELKNISDVNHEASRDMLEALKQIENSWHAYESNFQKVGKDLGETFDILQRGIAGYNDTTSKALLNNLRTFDKSIALAMQKIAGCNDDLREAVDDLVDSLKRSR